MYFSSLFFLLVILLSLRFLFFPNKTSYTFRLKKYCCLMLLLAITTVGCSLDVSVKSDNLQIPPPADPLVAHAGGGIYGYRYTNSLEALNNSYNNGFHLFELDFNWTKDGYPVCIHDWEPMVNRLLLQSPKILTYREFNQASTFQNLTLLNLKLLSDWLELHQDAYIVTDVKVDNYGFLQYIKSHYPSMMRQIIPQIYTLDEYEPVKALGYSNIILTLYRLDLPDDVIIDFAKKNPLFAVTLSEDKAFSMLTKRLSDYGMTTYVHTINSVTTYEELEKYGIHGIYTDYFEPNHWPY